MNYYTREILKSFSKCVHIDTCRSILRMIKASHHIIRASLRQDRDCRFIVVILFFLLLPLANVGCTYTHNIGPSCIHIQTDSKVYNIFERQPFYPSVDIYILYMYTYIVIGYSNNGRHHRRRRRRCKKGPKGSLLAAKRRNVFHLIGLWIIMLARGRGDGWRRTRGLQRKNDRNNRPEKSVTRRRRRHVPLVDPPGNCLFINR